MLIYGKTTPGLLPLRNDDTLLEKRLSVDRSSSVINILHYKKTHCMSNKKLGLNGP